MRIFGLVPRLNYDYPISKLIYGLCSILKEYPDTSPIEKLFDNENIYFTNHARTGLRLLLNSIGLSSSAKIGVQAFNCHTVFSAIKRAGFTPVFLDINNMFTIDLKDLKEKREYLDAIIVTHTFGIPADLDKIKQIVPDIPIIEDCAHSFLSKYKGKLTGTLGDAAIFSFGHGKFPAIGGGGMIVINNQYINTAFLKKIKKIKKESVLKEIFYLFKNHFLFLFHKPILYSFLTKPLLKKLDQIYDFSGKENDVEHCISKTNLYLLIKQSKNFNIILRKQQEINTKIIDIIESDILEESDELNIEWNGFTFPFLTNKENLDKIKNVFAKNHIEVGIHFRNSLKWAEYYGYKSNYCPRTEEILKKHLCIPIYYGLKKAKINLIFKSLKEIYDEHRFSRH